MSKSLFPKDPVLPQLQIAWNSDLMLEAFRKHLQPFGGANYDITNCKVERFRYRRKLRSIVLYQLEIVDKKSDVKKNIWLTGVIYPGERANRVYKKLIAVHPWSDIPDALLPFEPISYLSDLKMTVQVYPQDRYLNNLPLLITGPPPQLEKFLLDQFGKGNWKMDQCRVETVRYRPQEGVTLRYEVDSVESSTQEYQKKCFFIKVYRDEGGRKTFDLLKELYLQFSSGKSGFTTVKPLAYFEDLRALILEGAAGQSLEDIILEDNNAHAAILKSSAALAAFHQRKVDLSAHRPPEGTLSRAKKAGDFIQWALPNLRGSVEELMKKIEKEMQVISTCPTHLDMKVDHIFLGEKGLTFIDLDSFALSDPVFDAASLFVRMEMLPNLSSISQSKIKTMSEIFIEDYFSRVPYIWRKRFSVNYACAALKVALYHVQHQETKWSEQVPLIVNKAMEGLCFQK